MRFTSTSGLTYDLYCFEFYNRRFFCLGSLVGDQDIHEFVSSFDFKYLFIHNGHGDSTFKSNKLTINPFLLHKDIKENEKFKDENYELYHDKKVDIIDYGPTSFNGRYTCIGILDQLNIPDDAIFETFTINTPNIDNWLVENDKKYSALHKPISKSSIPHLYCAMPFVEIYNKIKISHYVTKDKKSYLDINSLGVILSADMGTTESNGFKRLNAFYKLSPAAGIRFCSREFMLSSRIEKLIEVAGYGDQWVKKHGRDIPINDRRKYKFGLRFFYQYVKKFNWAISKNRSIPPLRSIKEIDSNGKLIKIETARKFMYKIIFRDEYMAEFRLYRFEQVDKADLASDPGYNGADLTNKITHWPNGNSWYIDGHLDFTDPDDFIKFDGISKTELINYIGKKYTVTAKCDLYELFETWFPKKFINNMHFFNVNFLVKAANHISERDKEYCSINTGFLRFYHFDNDICRGTFITVNSILSNFACHYSIAREMVGEGRFNEEAFDLIPGFKRLYLHQLTVNEYGYINNDSYILPCNGNEKHKRMDRIVIQVSDAIQFINNGLYQNSRDLNSHWRKNANSLFTAFPEVTISSRIKGHSMNELYGNIPKLTF